VFNAIRVVRDSKNANCKTKFVLDACLDLVGKYLYFPWFRIWFRIHIYKERGRLKEVKPRKSILKIPTTIPCGTNIVGTQIRLENSYKSCIDLRFRVRVRQHSLERHADAESPIKNPVPMQLVLNIDAASLASTTETHQKQTADPNPSVGLHFRHPWENLEFGFSGLTNPSSSVFSPVPPILHPFLRFRFNSHETFSSDFEDAGRHTRFLLILLQ